MSRELATASSASWIPAFVFSFLPIARLLYRSVLRIGLALDGKIGYKDFSGDGYGRLSIIQKGDSQLKQEHRKAKTKWEADRLKTIYLLGIERSPTDVAEVLLKDERTILSYYQNYKDGNIDQLG